MVQDRAFTPRVDDASARTAPIIREVSPLSADADLSRPENKIRTASAIGINDMGLSDHGFHHGRPPIVQDMTIVNGDQVVAGADRKPLSQTAADAAKVRSGEGYFHSAERLLGGDFTHNEKKQFTDALRKNWATEHPNAKSLRKGDQLLTEQNREAVLSHISDPALKAKIAARLGASTTDNTAVPRQEPAEEARPSRTTRGIRKPADRPADRPAEQPEAGTRKPEVKVDKPIVPAFAQPTEYDNVPDGPLRNPHEKRFQVGDRFKGLTSTYGVGTLTASGLPYDREQMVAASREFPFGTVLQVTNNLTGKTVKVVITDNGPFAKERVKGPDGKMTWDRVVDISTGANRALGNPNLATLDYKVLHIPNNPWGGARRNVHDQAREDVVDAVRRYSRK
jgi:rare lipoprotein A (peptidoglycan hydrolase)